MAEHSQEPALFSISHKDFEGLKGMPDASAVDAYIHKSSAILRAAEMVRTSVPPDPDIVATVGAWVWSFQNITLELLSSDLPAGLDDLALKLRGISEYKKRQLPLKRVSDTRWTYVGVIVIPSKVIHRMALVLVSETMGKIGHISWVGADLMHERSLDIDEPVFVTKAIHPNGRKDHVTSISGQLSYVLLPLVVKGCAHSYKGTSKLDYAKKWYRIGYWYCRRYAFSEGTQRDLNQAVEFLTKASDTLAHTGPDDLRLQVSMSLSRTLGILFEDDEKVETIEASVAAAEKAWELVDRTHCEFKMVRETLALALEGRFEAVHAREDIDRAVDLRKEAVDTIVCSSETGSCPCVAVTWASFADALNVRYKAFFTEEDNHKMIIANKTALEHAPLNYRGQPSLLVNLGICLFRSFRKQQESLLPLLEESISYLKQSSMIANPQDLEPDTQYIVAHIFHQHYWWLRNFDSLNTSISLLQDLLRAPKGDISAEATQLLVTGLLNHHQYTREPYSLDEATELLESSEPQTTQPCDRGEAEGNCINPVLRHITSLFYLFDSSYRVEHLHRAISILQDFIENNPKETYHGGSALMNLGVAYMCLYEQVSNDLDDLDRAIKAFRESGVIMAQIDGTRTGQGEHEYNLGTTLVSRYRNHTAQSDISELEEGISLLERSKEMFGDVDEAPGDHRGWPVEARYALAKGLLARYTVHRNSSDVEEAMLLFASIPRIGGPADSILRKVWDWARCATRYQGLAQSLTAYDAVVQQVTILAGIEYPIDQRHDLLEEHSQWILEAVETALRVGRTDKAIEWLEQGRGLVWSQLTSLRTPINDLHRKSPALAELLREVGRELESAGTKSRMRLCDTKWSKETKISIHKEASSQYELAQKREDILQRIRTEIPGFSNFLRPLPSSTWSEHLPDSGPVVVVNVYLRRCDAIILLKGAQEPLHIPLPEFSFEIAAELSKALDTSLGLKARVRQSAGEVDEEFNDFESSGFELGFPDDPPTATYKLVDILRELWTRVAHPIICALEHHVPNLRLKCKCCECPPMTRIWWCPTGALTSLPLHAAGIYSGANPVSVGDYAVSSYTPTVAVLAQRLKRPVDIPASTSGLLLVSVPNAKEKSQISGTTKEVERINAKFKNSSIRLEGEKATIAATLQGMKSNSCIHLACHGSQETERPLQSKFSLFDGSLDLATIIQANLTSADLAFLSACETGTGTAKLSEEAVHLAAGMLAAGYRGVVATMWAIYDDYAPQLAEEFYQDLAARTDRSADGAIQVNGEHAAYALHHAVSQLRKTVGNTEESLLAWVPYVHYGL